MPLARDGQAPRSVLIEVSKGADALLITGQDRIDAHVIARLPDSVRVIATLSVGYDHIDLRAAANRGILVTNTPGVVTDATADNQSCSSWRPRGGRPRDRHS